MKSLRNILVEAARLAGDIQRDAFAENPSFLSSKYGGEGNSDFVTETDIATEEALRSFFRTRLPEFNVFGEELGALYDGNGKVIVIDPLDGTKLFGDGLPRFGPIVGVYDQGANIGSVEYNVLRDIMYVATPESGFERIGEEETIPENVFVIMSRIAREHPDEIVAAIKTEFPEAKVLLEEPDVIHRGRVFDGSVCAFFHSGLAYHDIAAAPLLGHTSRRLVTDHNGVPYGRFDPGEELRKYATGDRATIYSNPILVAPPEYHPGMLRALSSFKGLLDGIQDKGMERP